MYTPVGRSAEAETRSYDYLNAVSSGVGPAFSATLAAMPMPQDGLDALAPVRDRGGAALFLASVASSVGLSFGKLFCDPQAGGDALLLCLQFRSVRRDERSNVV
jgi:hypothetical protein